jgi:hypothetical protein
MNLLKKYPFHFLSLRLISVLIIWMAVGAGACSASVQPIQPTFPPLTIQDLVMHHTLSKETWIAHWTPEEGGVKIYDASQAGIGFVRPEDRYTPPNQLPQNDELHIRSSEPLLLDLVVIAAQDSTFLLTVLLDYQQVTFSLDGQSGLLHEIRVEKEGDLYIPIKIDVSGPGAHDLIIIAFRDPDNRPWDQDARDLAFGCLLSGRRAVVVVDNIDRPVREITPDISGVAPPSGVDFGIRVMFADMPASPSDTTHPSQRQMRMTAHAQVGESFPYQLWLSNYDLPNDIVDYGLMRFLDFHQVDFKGKDLYVAHFEGRQEAIVEDSFVLPSQPGVHEAQIVYVFDPYKSVLRSEVLAPFVFSSGCLGIEAR